MFEKVGDRRARAEDKDLGSQRLSVNHIAWLYQLLRPEKRWFNEPYCSHQSRYVRQAYSRGMSSALPMSGSGFGPGGRAERGAAFERATAPSTSVTAVAAARYGAAASRTSDSIARREQRVQRAGERVGKRVYTRDGVSAGPPRPGRSFLNPCDPGPAQGWQFM
jgi:hypothetical protein